MDKKPEYPERSILDRNPGGGPVLKNFWHSGGFKKKCSGEIRIGTAFKISLKDGEGDPRSPPGRREAGREHLRDPEIPAGPVVYFFEKYTENSTGLFYYHRSG